MGGNEPEYTKAGWRKGGEQLQKIENREEWRKTFGPNTNYPDALFGAETEDYIHFSSDYFAATSVMNIPSYNSLDQAILLCDWKQPSDHFQIQADLTYGATLTHVNDDLPKDDIRFYAKLQRFYRQEGDQSAYASKRSLDRLCILRGNTIKVYKEKGWGSKRTLRSVSGKPERTLQINDYIIDADALQVNTQPSITKTGIHDNVKPNQIIFRGTCTQTDSNWGSNKKDQIWVL